MRVKRFRPIVVRRAPGRGTEGRLLLANGARQAALGRSGIKALKCEGDGGTPYGRFAVRGVLYRADRGLTPRTRLPVQAIRTDDAWCDDPADRNYNRLIKLPKTHDGRERLKRDDHLYDLVLVLGYNDRPRIRGKGSAIFVHLARPGYTPTEGCIALSRRDLLALIAQTRPGSEIVVMY
jgi:L,D-peptidoglycan transpeptidase YkuD (ErfK/YbiS/YcfS/YnhG family)